MHHELLTQRALFLHWQKKGTLSQYFVTYLGLSLFGFNLKKKLYLLSNVQSHILSDYSSDYKARLIKLHMIPITLWLDLFFVISFKNPNSSFDLLHESECDMARYFTSRRPYFHEPQASENIACE